MTHLHIPDGVLPVLLWAPGLAARVGAPALAGVLVRARATRAQARLDPEARRRNLAGAFRVSEPRRYRGRRVLVVDDVVTTGATLDACATALLDAGASRVRCVTWARAD